MSKQPVDAIFKVTNNKLSNDVISIIRTTEYNSANAFADIQLEHRLLTTF